MAQAIQISDLTVPVSRTPLDMDFFNTRFTEIGNAINVASARMDAYDSTVNTLVSAGLTQLNTVMGPYLANIQAAAQLGFLTIAATGVSVALTQGNSATFVATSGGPLFTPTVFLLASDNTDATNWGLLQVTEWTVASNTLVANVVYSTKIQASNNWSISANAAVIPVIQALVTLAQNASASAVDAYASVESAISALEGLAAAISAGPVASVCGYTGTVTLITSDIGGLTDALATKASLTALSNGLATTQPSNTLLSSLAGLTLTANQLIYATSSTTLAAASLTTFGASLLALSNATAVLSAIGASPINLLFNAQTGTTYTMLTTDNALAVRCTNGSAITVTLPNNLPVGWNCLVEQGGAGQVAFSAASGATINNHNGQYKIVGQYATVGLYVRSNVDGVSAIYNLSGSTAF